MLLLKNMTYEQLYKLSEDISDLKELRLLKEELEEKTDTYNMENLQYTLKDHRRDCRILNFINRVIDIRITSMPSSQTGDAERSAENR